MTAGLKDGTWGPGSNMVATGLRPAQVQNVVATGHPTSVSLSWDAVEGATSYDVYRDGVLQAWTTGHDATSFTDQPGVYGWSGDGYGHSHKYEVVAVNRLFAFSGVGVVGSRRLPGAIWRCSWCGCGSRARSRAGVPGGR